jgi:hypothetical protein
MIGRNQPPREDLIALDSPFIDDPQGALTVEGESSNDEFELRWNEMDEASGARGWYAGSIESLVRLIQGLPYGRLKVIPSDQVPFEDGLRAILAALRFVVDFSFQVSSKYNWVGQKGSWRCYVFETAVRMGVFGDFVQMTLRCELISSEFLQTGKRLVCRSCARYIQM